MCRPNSDWCSCCCINYFFTIFKFMGSIWMDNSIIPFNNIKSIINIVIKRKWVYRSSHICFSNNWISRRFNISTCYSNWRCIFIIKSRISYNNFRDISRKMTMKFCTTSIRTNSWYTWWTYHIIVFSWICYYNIINLTITDIFF